MTVGVAAEVGGMAGSAGASGYRRDVISVGWIGQSRRGGVTEAAGVQVDCHWISRWVAGSDAGRGVCDVAQCV